MPMSIMRKEIGKKKIKSVTKFNCQNILDIGTSAYLLMSLRKFTIINKSKRINEQHINNTFKIMK